MTIREAICGTNAWEQDDRAEAGDALPSRQREVEAEEYRAMARLLQDQGNIEDAAAYYRVSLDLFPTAEAHTALGSVLAARGDWEAAIHECRKAIALDPDLGNPYNDLGVYLERMGCREEAMRWLEKAVDAPVYDCRHYPYYHMGRIREQQGRFIEARNAYQKSQEIDPDWEPAMLGLCRVLGFLN